MRKYLLLVFILTSFEVFSQDDLSARSAISEDIPTIATDPNRNPDKMDASKTPDFPKKIEYLLTRKPTKVLYGNPCAEEVTYKYGFIYLLNPKLDQNEFGNENAFWHNFKTHFKLMFKNGPFYKSKVRKEIRVCRESSGDFVY